MRAKTRKNKTSEKAQTRTDWEANHARIRDAMLLLIDRNKGRIPSHIVEAYNSQR